MIFFEYEANSKKFREMFGRNLPNVFKESVDRLSPYWRNEFDKMYYKHNNSIPNNKYYSSLFGKYKFNIEDEKDVNIEGIDASKNIEDVLEKYDDFSKQIEKDINDNKIDNAFNFYDDKKEIDNEIEDIIDTRIKK